MIDKNWALEQIEKRQSRCNWANLPKSFEYDAVKFVYNQLKPHFCKKREIKNRIAASRATTFDELKDAILKV